MDNKKSNENILFGIIDVPQEKKIEIDIPYINKQIDDYMKNRE